MGNQDISRAAFDPRKHYASVRLQQGRVIVDDDWNENERIAAEATRRERVAIIGPVGTSDDGLRLSNPRLVGGRINFDLGAGSYYVGGLRVESEAGFSYLTQPDALNMQPVSAPPGTRTDLVYLMAYEAPVSATEDSELLEVALGSVDTSQRMRVYGIVRVLPDVGELDCEAAWATLLDRWVDNKLGMLNGEHERVGDVTLTVSYTDEGVPDDLCEPPIGGGYLGAENQAIRVELVDDSTLVWGFDNGSPLYRAELSGDRQTLTLLTPPRDEAHWPLVGQTIEVLAWKARLPNGEKTATLAGHLSLAASNLDPVTGEVTLVDAVPTAGFDTWQTRADAADIEGDDGIYYYVRVWNRGPDRDSPPAIPYAPGVPVELGFTGLEVTIEGDHRQPRDYWIIAARPETPDQVVPWELEAGRAPHGVRRFFAPLAVIRWREDRDEAPRVLDCRTPFRPLTQQQDCCTFTVGDGLSSHGDFDDLATAVAQLPPTGGEICLLPGTHYASVELLNRENVTISGCGGRSRLLPNLETGGDILTAMNCANVALHNLDLVTVDGTAATFINCDTVRVTECRFLAYRNALDVERCTDVLIEDNIIRMLDKAGGDVAIYAHGDDIRILRNDLLVVPAGLMPPQDPDDSGDPDNPPPDPTDPCADPKGFYGNLGFLLIFLVWVWALAGLYLFLKRRNPFQTLGGIQIGSGSERVAIRDNRIMGGAGNGVTLGSDLEDVDEDDDRSDDEPFTFNQQGETFNGRAFVAGQPRGDFTLFFEDVDGHQVQVLVGPDGRFTGKVPAGRYGVFTSEPSYRVADILQDGVDEFEQPIYHVDIAESTREVLGVADVLAFIYDVAIERNDIANMGLSGIGLPVVDEADVKRLKADEELAANRGYIALLFLVFLVSGGINGFVIGLTIYRNRITRCLQNAQLPGVGNPLLERGLGGISLGLCESVLIAENAVEDCGRDHVAPTCGVFVSLTSGLDLSANHITNNGPLDLTLQAEPQAGPRGGIMIGYASAVSMAANLGSGQSEKELEAESAATTTLEGAPFGETTAGARFATAPGLAGVETINSIAAAAALRTAVPPEGRHAARINENYVVQPVGRALTLNANGAVAVSNNQFFSDYALPAAVQRRSNGFAGTLLGLAAPVLLGVDSSLVSVFNMGRATYLSTFMGGTATTKARLPQLSGGVSVSTAGGDVLFTDNQLRQGHTLDNFNVVFVLTLDDLSFQGNTIDVLNGDSIFATVLLSAITLRASNNRMKESLAFLEAVIKKVASGDLTEKNIEAIRTALLRYSLMTLTLAFNNTLNNQGHYCITAASLAPSLTIETANQSGLAALGTSDEFKLCQDDDPRVKALALFLLYTLLGSVALSQTSAKMAPGG